MTKAYLRVSSTEQNIDRQMLAVKEYRPELRDEDIYVDKQSGKNFDRASYQKLKADLQAGDELIIKELDRLGRNKEGIKDELRWFREHKITVRILNVPTTLADYEGQEWIFEMVSNIMIEVLGAYAEEERKSIKSRQAEGIAAAKARGQELGRPKKSTEGFVEAYKKWLSGSITVKAACEELGISDKIWYREAKRVS